MIQVAAHCVVKYAGDTHDTSKWQLTVLLNTQETRMIQVAAHCVVKYVRDTHDTSGSSQCC